MVLFKGYISTDSGRGISSLTVIGMEAISFSEQATAARRDYFAGSNSGVVGQDVRDVGDVIEKFTGDPPGCRG